MRHSRQQTAHMVSSSIDLPSDTYKQYQHTCAPALMRKVRKVRAMLQAETTFGQRSVHNPIESNRLIILQGEKRKFILSLVFEQCW